MKAMSYICPREEVEEKRNWLKGMGLTILRQVSIIDIESILPNTQVMLVFIVPNKETETYLRIKYPEGTFRDCSA